MAKNNQSVSDSDTNNTAAENVNAAKNTEAATTETATKQQTTKAKYEGVTNFAYVGPSLPGGRLKSLSTLKGTYAQVTDYYKDAIEQYPSVARLIVPVASLAESREKTQKSGNLMYNYYQEIAAAIKAKGVE